MTINCVIIEDEPLAMERLKSYVLQVKYLNLVQCIDNAFDAISLIKTEKIDLLLLDIQMDGFTGVQLLESLTKRPEVIITTAFDQYALKGFELNVSDYLLKPFTFERFLQAIGKVYDKLNLQNQTETRNYIFIKTEYRLEKVQLQDILFIEGMRDYRSIVTTEKRIMTLQTFGELEQELPAKQFCRVHKSYIVALGKIETIERDRIRIGEELIPISDTFKADFYKRIG
ncbi:MAG: LytTR family DNA-binding domain-containing protein [Mucilaginibacter sp.]|uniref:LytR/AlgR family response regulator transcription factor n=1 Tax=Mucilaginibacter sp. TaxID=1882438 RepID=UPI0032679074